jgi:tetratricopeptide (TPR) repeat protein
MKSRRIPTFARNQMQIGSLATLTVAALILTTACSSVNSGHRASADLPIAPSGTPEGVSLLGKDLHAREFSAETRQRLERDLTRAMAAYDHTPTNADSIIWVGRRLGYLERYRDAIAAFSKGIELHPNDSRLYRHRGHRYITLRKFDLAVADLEKAAQLIQGTADEMEEDGAPNSRNIPTSTAQGNIYYHLALAHYLLGHYDKALVSWNDAMRIARNDDSRVSLADWQYITLRRLGRDDEARQVLVPITKDLNVIENTAYYRRLQMYKGELPPDSLLTQGSTDELQFVTQGYGVANWYLANGDSTRARQIMDQMLAARYWAAFGYIAAEVDVAGWPKKP